MPRCAVVVAATLLLLVGPDSRPASAQAVSPRDEDALITDTLSGEAAIRALEAKMQAGVLHQDLRTLRQLWAEDFMVNAPRNVVVPTRSAVLDVFRKGIPDYSVFEPRIEEIRIRDGTAVVMGRETVKPVGDAPHAGKTVRRRYTHVWKREGDRWRLFARHAHIVSIN
jgi:ketosteroid isomerase-like protein